MPAYYNEIDPFAAAWLHELIKADLIAPGEVDERSIEEVRPDDLRGFTQCHFFAGIGGWSYALRLAGWPDDEPVWTGSCPCPPFSSAGTKKACPRCQGTNPVPHVGRTGFFVCCLCNHEWLADARHLWPELWRLISFSRPVAFFGEQVAGDDGKTWLALVRASLEILGYAVGAKDLCSAGVGASDIRQRLYFVAHTQKFGTPRHTEAGESDAEGRGATGNLEHAAINRRTRRRTSKAGAEPNEQSSRAKKQRLGDVGDMGHSPKRRDGTFQRGSGEGAEQPIETGGSSLSVELAHPDSAESVDGHLQRGGRLLQPEENPLAGFWRDAEWIYCQDGKYRPVEPGTFPLAHGATNRVGRLRGYGNAINAEVAKAFIEAYMEIR